MKISGFKRILADDLPSEYKQLANKIAYSINPFAEEVINLLNGRIATDNINQKYIEITLEINSDGTPKQTTVFKSNIIGRVKGLDIQYLENITNVNTYPTAAPFITWSESDSFVTIKHITGLQTGNKWKIRVLVKGD